MPASDPGLRDQWLARAARMLHARGYRDGSLRTIAGELGTSHRMLIYHFGSAEGFWQAVLGELRAHDQKALQERIARGKPPTLEQTFRELTTPSGLRRMRLVFQIYGEALKDPARFREFLAQVVTSWLEPMAGSIQTQRRCSREHALRDARLDLAVMRGLILDLLTTGDRAGTMAALHEHARRTRSRKTRR